MFARSLAAVLSLVLLLVVGCGGDDPPVTPTPAVPLTPTAVATSAAGLTPVVVSTTSVPITPTAVATSAAGVTPTTVAAAGCPGGWSSQNVPGRAYHFCLPPGWTAQLLSAAGSMATPVPAGGSLASEPVGSLVLASSPEQGANTTPGAVNNGTLIRIYMTSVQVGFAVPALPLCSGAAGSVAGRPTSICNLDNTSAATNPFRVQEWFSQPSNPAIAVQAFTGKDVLAAGQALAVQVVGTIRFD